MLRASSSVLPPTPSPSHCEPVSGAVRSATVRRPLERLGFVPDRRASSSSGGAVWIGRGGVRW